jgi:ABC-2 type transport system permease protein
LPLLYNLISEDRESGALALIASQPVPLAVVAGVRLGVRLLVPVVLTILASAAALLLFADGWPQVASLPFTAWCGAVVATALFWGGVAMLVNLARWRSATNATVIAACWLTTTVLAPAVLGEIAAAAVPVPSRISLINAVRHAGNLSSTQLAALVSSYYEEHPDAVRTRHSADDTAIRGLAQQDEVDRRIEPLLNAYRQATTRQQALVQQMRVVSPPLVIYEGVTELAGTTAARHHRFAEQVDAYHRAWRDYFYPLVHKRIAMTRTLYEAAPRFVFHDEPQSARVRRAGLLFLFVSVLGLAAIALAVRRVSRLTNLS